MSGFRRYGRTLVKCSVRLSHDDLGEIVAETRDISETGVFINCREFLGNVAIGDQFEAELYSACNQVSTTHLKVVRLTEEGFGLAFD